MSASRPGAAASGSGGSLAARSAPMRLPSVPSRMSAVTEEHFCSTASAPPVAASCLMPAARCHRAPPAHPPIGALSEPLVVGNMGRPADFGLVDLDAIATTALQPVIEDLGVGVD